VRLNFRMAAVFLLGPAVSGAASLSQPAKRAFESYITSVETRLAKQGSPGTMRELPAGVVRVEPVNGGSWRVSGGLLHHWRAAVLVPGAGTRDLLALLQDYDHLARYYAPEVVSSRALTGDAGRAMIAMRFKKHQVITVVLDAEFETQSGLEGETRGYSISRSTHVWQVDRAGSPGERRRAEGADDGFLWRLNSYWTFEERRDGLLMECEAVSLTRDVPAGLGWLIRPIVERLPRASLEFTMTATKNALTASAIRRQNDDRAN
jgi:hypothetical protein